MKNVQNLFKAVIRINSYNEEFDFTNPMNTGNSTRSSGSGFFINKHGHILTCAHCVEHAKKVTCNIPSEGQTEFKVEILGICPYFDVAMLKIKDYKVKHVLKLANKSTRVEPGTETYAIGFPLGTETLKITKGILSGIQDNFYQTDTPINPGNSGGPLIIGDRVIGINAAGIVLADNIGYAVPTYRVDLIKNELEKKNNLIHYPSLLLEYQKSNPKFKSCLKHKCDGGVIINSIPEASVFQHCKLKEGDVLCTINGIKIDTFGHMETLWLNQKMNITNFVSNLKLDSTVTVEFFREGKKRKSTFKFKEIKAPIRQIFPLFEKKAFDFIEHEGMIFMNLTLNHLEKKELKNPETAKYMLEKNRSEGKVLLVNILSDSSINDWKIFSKGDIITHVNNKKVKDIHAMKGLLKTTLKCGSISMKNSKNQIIYI